MQHHWNDQIRPPNHWIALHEYPVRYRQRWDPEHARAFYRHWAESIPDAGCNCRGNWIALDIAFDFSTPRKFFDCGVVGHNTVNATLGKTVITFEHAYAIWWQQ